MECFHIHLTSLQRCNNGREGARRQIRSLAGCDKETKVRSDYRHLEHLQPATKEKCPVVFCRK